ncbi:MAG: hypothetical protein P1U74_08190 [Legionellaceae bacterium]|nr:hypothetical protein [Legionellaceae bacterium]
MLEKITGSDINTITVGPIYKVRCLRYIDMDTDSEIKKLNISIYESGNFYLFLELNLESYNTINQYIGSASIASIDTTAEASHTIHLRFDESKHGEFYDLLGKIHRACPNFIPVRDSFITEITPYIQPASTSTESTSYILGSIDNW